MFIIGAKDNGFRHPTGVFPVFVTTEILGNNGIHGNFFFLFLFKSAVSAISA